MTKSEVIIRTPEQKKAHKGYLNSLKREEIDQAIRHAFNTLRGNAISFEELQALYSKLSELGVVIKADRELGMTPIDKPMKLKKMVEVLNKALDEAGGTDPEIGFFLGDEEFELERIGQFGVMPDVTINLKEKLGYGAFEPLIKGND